MMVTLAVTGTLRIGDTMRRSIAARPLRGHRLFSLSLATALAVSGIAAAPAFAEDSSVSGTAQVTAADVSAPVLVSSDVEVSHTSLSDGPVTVTTRVRITDETGTTAPTIVVDSPTGQDYGFDMTLVSGSITDGTWEGSVEIPTTAAPGEWNVTLYPLSDTLGNSAGSAATTLETITLTATSALTAPTPKISGTAKVGQTLSVTSADTESFTPAADAVSYQWLRNGTAIAGATSQTYIVTTSDVGTALSVTVTGTKAGYVTASAFSSKTAVVPPATLRTSAPAILGTVKVGQALTVKVGTWTSGTNFKFQWLRNGSAISRATSYTYKLTSADVGKQISVKVTGSKSGYTTVTSASASVRWTLVQSSPRIAGTTTMGQALTAKVGTWTSGTAFKFQWLRNGSAIARATSSTYRLTSADVGKQISVKVTGSKSGYNSASRTSGKTAKIAKATLTAATPKIGGTAKYGSTLTAKVGTWTSGTAFKFQWLRNGSAIARATSSTYRLTSADVGKQISVKVTGSKSGYNSASRTSGKTAKIAKATLTAATPKIGGTAKYGSTLTAKVGTWTSGTAFKFQWLRNGKAISRATSSTYRLTSADVGKQISVKVTGSKSGYNSASRTSGKTAKIVKATHPSSASPSGWNCPSWAPIKGNANSMIYHMPGGRWYAKTKPEQCFSTQAAAQAAGYRAAKG
jgi:hypothetical protein